MKIDPYNHKERYLNWKDSLDKNALEISTLNAEVFLDYIFDMEQGLNIANGSRKGARSYIRLNTIKQRLLFLIKIFEGEYGLDDITKIRERELHDFFTKMRNGIVKRKYV